MVVTMLRLTEFSEGVTHKLIHVDRESDPTTIDSIFANKSCMKNALGISVIILMTPVVVVVHMDVELL